MRLHEYSLDSATVINRRLKNNSYKALLAEEALNPTDGNLSSRQKTTVFCLSKDSII
jgi:hypothetical protein